MTLPIPRLVHSADHRPAAGPKSCANRLDLPAPLRRRQARGDLRLTMAARWSRYVREAFRSREACASHYGVAFQTACNWFDGLHAPTSAIYARTAIEDGARLHRVMTGQPA